MHSIGNRIITFLPPEQIEPEALKQIENTSSVPFLFRHVAVMPDTHYGKGSTVGTVLATKEAIIPAAVGVDIGCGMIAVKTNLRYDLRYPKYVPISVQTVGDASIVSNVASESFMISDKLAEIRAGIERRIPMSAGKFNNKITESAARRVAELYEIDGHKTADLLSSNWREQLGTLGGGNHFIEICYDEQSTIWVTLHSGSRGVGNKIGNYYIDLAYKKLPEFQRMSLPDKDLAYLVEGTEEFNAYIRDLRWAQHFALLNREEMMDRVMTQLAETICGDHRKAAELEVERINCHHNFTQIENHFDSNVWVTRKGAIAADVGKRGMIPGSMGTASYIVTGKGEKMSFCSAPHGAGRRMSRKKASATFTMEDFDLAMMGIEHRRSEVLLDELPLAYKDIHEVIKNAHELISVDTVLKQILNVKGD